MSSTSSSDKSSRSTSTSSSTSRTVSTSVPSASVGQGSNSNINASTSSGRQDPTSQSLHEVDEAFLGSLMGSSSTCLLEDLTKLELGSVELVVPALDDRPWRAPEGCFTVYEGFFICGLTFPLPRLLLDYCDKRKVALSQLAPSSIHNMLTLQKLGRECGFEIDLPFFEGVTSLSVVKGDSSLYYVKTKPGCGIICGAPNKIKDWKRRFFYVRKNQASVLDCQRPIRNCWSHVVDRRASKALNTVQKNQANKIRDLSCTWFPKIVESRAEKSRQRKPSKSSARSPKPSKSSARSPSPIMMPGSDEDYFFDISKIMALGAESSRSVEETDGGLPIIEEPAEQTPGGLAVIAEETVDELPVVEKSTEQTPGGLPIIVADLVEPMHTEKPKKASKRQRTEASSDRERFPSTGRRIQPKDADFVEDPVACATIFYDLKHPGVSGDVPPLSELEESETYAQFARNEFKNQALLKKLVVDYQRKLTEARKENSETAKVIKLRDEISQLCDVNFRSGEKLKEKSARCSSLRAELAESRKAGKKQLKELKALEEYSKEARARADRLRERLIYVDKVKSITKRADQARAICKTLNDLVISGFKIPPKMIAEVEKNAKHYEAKLKEFEPVELQEGDLSPLEPYASKLGELEELSGDKVPSADEHMREADDEVPQDV